MSWDEIKLPIYEKWKTYWFDTHPSNIAEYSWNYLFTGGKQIRPKLFCELWQYLSPDSTINAELAFAIECIHVASLILDDIPWMDNASARRGKPTLHIIFSQRKACLLFHDVMYMVYLIWIANKPNHIDKYEWEKFILEKMMHLSLGQWYDLQKKGTLIELASLKTGILFELVTECVAICIELDTTFWKSWGNSLGILFQWMDDWHDREEDKLQINRNAFNESYDETITIYGEIWTKIEMGIGKSWFKTDFGIFMKSYFTDKMNIPEQIIAIHLSDIHIPYPIIITLPSISVSVFALHTTFHIGKDYIKKMCTLLQIIIQNINKHIERYKKYTEKYITKYSARYDRIVKLLWQFDEETWEHHPEAIKLATDIYHQSMKDMKELV